MQGGGKNFQYSSFIRANQKLMLNLIMSHSSLLFEGPRGCGKTTLVENLLIKSKFPYAKINAMLGEKKHNFVKILWTQLKKLFGYSNSSQCMSLESLARSMSVLKNEVSKQKYESVLSKQVIYIFVDNMEELHLNERFLSSMLAFKQNLKVKIAFIFCGINTSTKLMLYQRPICDTINFVLPKPDKPFILAVVTHHMEGQFIKATQSLLNRCRDIENSKMNAGIKELIQELEKGEKLLDLFANNVVQSIYLVETDLEAIKRLSHTFLKKLLEKYDQIFEKFAPSNSDSKPERYQNEKIKLMRILTDVSFKDYANKILEFGSENAWIFSRRQQEENIEDQYFERKVFYPELIKTSIYFAEVCIENDDPKRFKQEKRKTKKGFQYKTQKTKIKKHNPFRVISIGETLESQIRMSTKEKRLKQHSMDYYTCFQYLQEEGDLRIMGKSGAYGIGKLQLRTNEQEAIQFMKYIDLKMEQFKV